MTMNEINIGVGILYTLVAGIMLFVTFRRNSRQDDSNEASTMTTLIVKLEAISTGITEIKAELNTLKNDQRLDHDRVLIIDQSVKSAWKQIDEINGCLGRKSVSNGAYNDHGNRRGGYHQEQDD